MSYGKHQSFYLKKHWITKGILSIIEDSGIFLNNEGYKRLGIGKNMQQSLRYWLEASNISEYDKENKEHTLTYFGNKIYDYDLSCSNPITLLIIQYFIVNKLEGNGPFSHSFAYLFNEFENYYLSKDQLKKELFTYSNNSVAENTINKDVDCLIQTYTNKTMKHPEDKNVSLLSALDLIIRDDEYYYKKALDINKFTSLGILFLISFENHQNKMPLQLDNITSKIGRAFNLRRSNIIDALDVCSNLGFNVQIIRTNNLDIVTIGESYDNLLDTIYLRSEEL